MLIAQNPELHRIYMLSFDILRKVSRNKGLASVGKLKIFTPETEQSCRKIMLFSNFCNKLSKIKNTKFFYRIFFKVLQILSRFSYALRFASKRAKEKHKIC